MFAATEGIQVNWAGIGIAVLLLALNGFFVAAEFALLAARRSRIEQLAAEGDRRARHALAGLREITLMLAGAQLGITMCSLGLGAVAEPAVAGIIEGILGEAFSLSDTTRHIIAFSIGLSIVVFLHMVVAEMAPKSWAIAHPGEVRAPARTSVPAVRQHPATADPVPERHGEHRGEGRRRRAAGRAGDGSLSERPAPADRGVGRSRRDRRG